MFESLTFSEFDRPRGKFSNQRTHTKGQASLHGGMQAIGDEVHYAIVLLACRASIRQDSRNGHAAHVTNQDRPILSRR
jgi:hypothetical protein